MAFLSVFNAFSDMLRSNETINRSNQGWLFTMIKEVPHHVKQSHTHHGISTKVNSLLRLVKKWMGINCKAFWRFTDLGKILAIICFLGFTLLEKHIELFAFCCIFPKLASKRIDINQSTCLPPPLSLTLDTRQGCIDDLACIKNREVKYQAAQSQSKTHYNNQN